MNERFKNLFFNNTIVSLEYFSISGRFDNKLFLLWISYFFLNPVDKDTMPFFIRLLYKNPSLTRCKKKL
ncbi:hypothetical protein LEP1GSC162_2859, partial [Leptospira santarosai str. CBC1531]